MNLEKKYLNMGIQRKAHNVQAYVSGVMSTKAREDPDGVAE